MSDAQLEASYQRWFIAGAYDALASIVFAPLGGLASLRGAALRHFQVAPGERVLELGCGSGGVTRLLCGAGARVTAVDWSAPMLKKAARRAPDAAFVRSELTSYRPETGAFDVVLFSFVLHELDAPARAQALAVARDAVASHGRLAIVDHALPDRGLMARGMSQLVHGFEPPTSRGRWLEWGAAESEIQRLGFRPARRVTLASGLAFALTAEPVYPLAAFPASVNDQCV